MPIPDLNEEGFLPPGVHEASLEEIQERFGRFQRTDRRVGLFRRLSDFLAEAQSTGHLAGIIVDGSFTTGKEEPSDVDLVLILRGDYDFGAELRPFEYNVLSKRRVRSRYKFDILVAREGSAAYHKYAAFFQQVKDRPGLYKGVLRVLP